MTAATARRKANKPTFSIYPAASDAYARLAWNLERLEVLECERQTDAIRKLASLTRTRIDILYRITDRDTRLREMPVWTAKAAV